MDKMTEQMAIEVIKKLVPKTCKKVDGRLKGGFDDWESDEGRAIQAAIQALEEIQQYRAIGTVQHCREAVEKSQEMKLKPPIAGTFEYKGICPVCRNKILISENYCSQCGQKVGR